MVGQYEGYTAQCLRFEIDAPAVSTYLKVAPVFHCLHGELPKFRMLFPVFESQAAHSTILLAYLGA